MHFHILVDARLTSRNPQVKGNILQHKQKMKEIPPKKTYCLPSQPKDSCGAPGKAEAPEFFNRIFDGSQFSEI
jgi:hypothetical protein